MKGFEMKFSVVLIFLITLVSQNLTAFETGYRGRCNEVLEWAEGVEGGH